MEKDGKTLGVDDAAEVLEEILDAQNRARYIGLKLKVPQRIFDGTYSQPCDHLYAVIMEYLKQIEPRPTWRAIANSLRSPLVNLPHMAQRIERTYLPSTPTPPDQVSQSAQPTAVSQSAQRTAVSQTAPPTAVSQSAQPTAVSQSAQPTAVSQSAQPTAVSQTAQPTAVSQSAQPTAVSQSAQPTAVSQSAQPTAVSQSAQPTAVSQTAPPTGVSQFSQPTAVSQSASPTGVSQSAQDFQLSSQTQHRETSCTTLPHQLVVASTNVWDPLSEITSDDTCVTIASSSDMPHTDTPDTTSAYAPTQKAPGSLLGKFTPKEISSDRQSLCQELPDARPMSIQYVQAKIRRFEKLFNELKTATKENLKRCNVTIEKIADTLTSLPADDMEEHKLFLESHLSALYQAADHSELFGAMNFHWNYLAYHLLDHLIREFELERVRGQMETYKRDLQQFRMQVPLKLFCQSHKRKQVDPPPGFQKVVGKFEWPDHVTLEIAEKFRQEFACHYSLRECAMMLTVILPCSFIVSWFIPVSVVDKLKAKIPEEILEKYFTTKLEIAGDCIYQYAKHKEHVPAVPPSTSGGSSTGASAGVSPHPSSRDKIENQEKTMTEQEYDFVQDPSKDFFCPVTFGLLLKPHQTTCCGHHLSDEAATRIQGEGGACPMCNNQSLATTPDIYFRRQVHALHVLCRHKERGCGWEGELSALEHHVLSCPRKNSPLGTRATEVAHSERNQITLQCHTQKKTAPRGMLRGSAAADQNFAYFTSWNSNAVYRYLLNEDEWHVLPSCPYEDTGLFFVDGALTAVGGWEGSCRTNKLVTLQQEQWIEKYPPMNVARSRPAIVNACAGGYRDVVVIGGFDDASSWTAVVEVLNIERMTWSQLTSLPQPLYCPSATISDNKLYVVGDSNSYSCSVQDLVFRNQPTRSISHTPTWTRLSRLPVADSTAATFCGQLVIIGGKRDGSPVNSIHQLVDGLWVMIGSMSSRRRLCLVATQSPDKMVVVGGYNASTTKIDSVEVCVVGF